MTKYRINKTVIKKGFVRLVRQNLVNGKCKLPRALCKAGEVNYERAGGEKKYEL